MAEAEKQVEMLELKLPDGSVRQVPKGTTPQAVAESIGAGLARAALAAKLNGKIIELNRPITESGEFAILTWNDEEGQDVFHHTSTHIMAQAVKRLWPKARLGTGPAIENGFYYDIDIPEQIGPDDLEKIEAEMKKIVEADYPLVREVWSREEALRFFKEQGEDFKVEIIQDLPEDETISVYRQGEWTDLCAGPHLPSTGWVKSFKLLSVAGAYWRADESRPMLQRLYGTSFPKQNELEQYLWQIEEAKRRDHRKLGPELGLFTFHEVAPGWPFWLDKGRKLYLTLENFSRELQEARGYQEVQTPVVMRSELWHRSGHWEHYKENMYVFNMDEEVYGIKPMNCPAHALLYASELHSYRDLPIRMSEYNQLARYERSGTLHGLMRVRGFHQDDAHLFVREDQIEGEIKGVIDLLDEIYKAFDMPYEIKLSTRPDDFMGEIELWEKAEADLARALESAGRTYKINPGDGAFYGPKLDFDVTDSLGRKWQTATIQLDFQMPRKFDLTYVDSDGSEKRPVMIHRAILGSLERFIGILTEHFAGAFPTWLAPEQVRIIPITDRHLDYAAEVRDRLAKEGVRVTVDRRNEKMGYKIRQAQLEKIPYMLVVGDKEREQGAVAVRSRKEGDQGARPLEEFVEALLAEIRERRVS